MHPYDRCGFSQMTKAQDDLYWNYVIARFAAYRNVWWSLANEYDLMRAKTLEDWERYAAILCAKDPYNHPALHPQLHRVLRLHRPWITHCSMQRQDLYRHVEYTDEYRTRYGKPVVWDEIAYEGNIDMGWGNISGQELTRRFWEASLRGGYAGHGGRPFLDPENDILWWSHGGVLHGESPARIRFLHRILEETPGPRPEAGAVIVRRDRGRAGLRFLRAGRRVRDHYYGFGRHLFPRFPEAGRRAVARGGHRYVEHDGRGRRRPCRQVPHRPAGPGVHRRPPDACERGIRGAKRLTRVLQTFRKTHVDFTFTWFFRPDSCDLFMCDL